MAWYGATLKHRFATGNVIMLLITRLSAQHGGRGAVTTLPSLPLIDGYCKCLYSYYDPKSTVFELPFSNVYNQ